MVRDLVVVDVSILSTLINKQIFSNDDNTSCVLMIPIK